MIRGTRRPGGAGRRSSGRKIRGGGKGGGTSKIGFWAEAFGCGLLLVLVGFGLMLASGLGLIWLKAAT